MKYSIIFILLILILFATGCAQCNQDSDCVPAKCCHPTECTSKSEKPDCSGILCTEICAPGTLDCGQGSCKCIQGNCKAEINKQTSELIV